MARVSATWSAASPGEPGANVGFAAKRDRPMETISYGRGFVGFECGGPALVELDF